ncbi:grasp-with-spasm system SPASM domain peptide maturase [Flavobacterium sp. Root420]|uniref:grasp-with-spasm system SPASM domain peptide maturase n=1 Tax=Flavobacterium sp. Root420 TaxID=1736533 RepID=UPI0006FF5C79|nr:grasp-with-spasm system SPASM domain peptide maturase [Flavobacterium sp. Root420]KQX10221.1 hypothetical protein ASC72_21300 [Flavobacterium sp. Root420]
MKHSNFNLFADCIPVKGFNRSIICDTRNNNYHFIPNALFDLLEMYEGKTVADVKNHFEHKYDEIIDEYFDFLIENKLIFFNSNPNLFPKINTSWDSPSLITNIIIDYDEILHDFNNLIPQFEKLKCSYIQLRFYKHVDVDYIKNIVSQLNNKKSRVISIDFILPYYDGFDLEAVNMLLLENRRIHSLVFFNSPVDRNYQPLRQKMGYLMMVKRNIINEKHCGIINNEYFYSNIKLFSESLTHNTCLNRKISIDKEGNIKNCPSMSENFGNIKSSNLNTALNHPDFKKYWNISKDKVEVCKDCEFRHICTDCRAYVENSENQYSKPLKCGYNPYTNVWENWSDSPLKQKAIKHYDMQEFVF